MFGKGFGTSFGSNSFAPTTNTTAPFGSTSSPFGTPGFGSQTTGFGTTAGFGQQPPANTNAFGTGGTTLGNFGSSTTSTTNFGFPSSTPSNTFGSSPFGTTGGGFGSTASSPAKALFGGAQAFAGTSAPNTGGALFGTSASAPAQPSTGLFGGASTSYAGGGFGVTEVQGTGNPKFAVTLENDVGGNLSYHSITQMNQYKNKSFEELRHEDYNLGRNKGNTSSSATASPFGTTSNTTSPFGNTGATTAPLFGATNTTSPFGTTSNPTSPFGGTPTSPFGAPANTTSPFGGATNAFGGGSSTTSPFGGLGTGTAFGATNTPSPFGTTTSTASSPFGNPGGASIFGAGSTAAPSPFGGTTGTTSSPYGTTNTFGAPATTTATPSLFGATPTANPSPFGTTGTTNSAFGTAQLTNPSPFGNVGTTSTSPFGAQTTNPSPFGNVGTTSPSSPFGNTNPSLFGTAQTTTPSIFGSTATTTAAPSLFGTTSTPTPTTYATSPFTTGFGTTFGAPTTQSLFSSALPSGFPSNFGATTTTPTTTNLFGTPTGVTNQALIATVNDPNPFGVCPTPSTPNTSSYTTVPSTPPSTPPFVLGSFGQKLPDNVVTPSPKYYHVPKIPSSIAQLCKTSTPRPRPPLNKSGSAIKIGPDTGIGSNMTTDMIKPKYPIKKLVIDLPTVEHYDSSVSEVQVIRDENDSNQRPVLRPLTQIQTPNGSENSFTYTPSKEDIIIHKPRGSNVGFYPTDSEVSEIQIRNNEFVNHSPPRSPTHHHHINNNSNNNNSLPILTQTDYFIQPSIEELKKLSSDELSCVKNFKIGRRNIGEVEWEGETDVRGLNLNEIVILQPKQVSVYPDDKDKPPVGEGLNKKAIITLERCWPVDKDSNLPISDPERIQNFEKKIKNTTKRLGAQFISYNHETGEWMFVVEHFSKYGLLDDDDDDDEDLSPGQNTPHSETTEKSDQPFLTKDDLRTNGEVEMPPSIGIHDELPVDSDEDEISITTPIHSVSKAYHPTKVVTLPRQLGMDATRFRNMYDMIDEEHDAGLTYTKLYPHIESQEEPSPFFQNTSRYIQNEPTFGVPSLTPVSNHQPLTLALPSTQQTQGLNFVNKTIATQPAQKNIFERQSTLELIKPTEFGSGKPEGLGQLLDVGLFLGRSFRASFGPNGLIAHCGKPISSDAQKHKSGFSIGNVHVEKISVVPEVKGRTQAETLYLNSLQTHLECSVNPSTKLNVTMQDEGDEEMHEREKNTVTPAFKLEDFCTIINRNVLEHSNGTDFHSELVWGLLNALWGEEGEKNNHIKNPPPMKESLIRKLALNKWLRNAVKSRAEKEIQKLTNNRSSPLDLIFTYLTSKQVPEAVNLAIKNKDYRLATLIAQVWSELSKSHEAQDFIEEGDFMKTNDIIKFQVKVWSESGASDYIDEKRLKLYELLSGDVLKGDYKQIDWLRCFGVHFWYVAGPNKHISDSITSYTNAVSKGFATPALPPYFVKDGSKVEGIPHVDTVYGLLRLYSHYTHHTSIGNAGGVDEKRVSGVLGRVVSPHSYSSYPLNYHLSWHLYTTLKSIPDLNSMVDLEIPEIVHTGYAFQLECVGLWEWSIYVLLHLSDTSKTIKIVKEILHRHAPDLNEKCVDFLVSKLGIPNIWILEAKAIYSVYNMDPYQKQQINLRSAGLWSQLNSLVTKYIAPMYISRRMEKDVKALLETLLEMEKYSHLISDWKTGGGLYLKYLQVIRSSTPDKKAIFELIDTAKSIRIDLENRIRHNRAQRGVLGVGGGPLFDESLRRVVLSDIIVSLIEYLYSQEEKLQVSLSERQQTMYEILSRRKQLPIPEDYYSSIQQKYTQLITS